MQIATADDRIERAEPRLPDAIGTFMGRDALSLAAAYLKLTRDSTVLLPAYLCYEVLRPFLGQTRVEFYEVGPNLTVDPDEIRRKLKGSKVDLTIIIHYFGFLQPHGKEISDVCAAEGSLVLEDCAHSLLTKQSGDVGDLSVYSFRKILPVPDGGGLVARIAGNDAAVKFHPQFYSDVLSLLASAKSSLRFKSQKLSRAGFASENRGSSATRKSARVLPMSSFTKKRMKKLSLPDIFEQRRASFRFWQDVAARSHSVKPIFDTLPPGVCPMNFPVRLKDRDALKARALERGVALTTYWRLPDCIGQEFDSSRALAREVAGLPVGPEASEREREILAGLIAAS